MGAPILNCLRESSDLADLLWDLCEFGVLEEEAPDWFALESGESVQVVGKDACGGRFCLYPASEDYSGRLLYIDSEGQAGVIAQSLSQAIRIMIALPYWSDCLHFSGGGDVDEMRSAHALLETRLRQRKPELENSRAMLLQSFGLEPLTAAVEALHGAVADGANLRIVATCDGSPYASLCNAFVLRE